MISVTGHRGARGLAPENTLAAFRLARELGCDAVELDVQLTSDGELAVIHDETLERTTNGHGRVSACTIAELKRLDAGKGERIPTVGEVLDLLGESRLVIQMELKGPGTEEAAARAVRDRRLESRVAFTSFHHRRVLKMKSLLPDVTTGILVTCSPVDPKGLLDSAGVDNLHVNEARLDRELVAAVHAAGHRIYAWGHIVEIPVIDRVIALGVDAIGSDRPDLVIEQLRK